MTAPDGVIDNGEFANEHTRSRFGATWQRCRSRACRLNFASRLVVALVFVLGVAFCIWAGWLAGAIFGLRQAEPMLTGPAGPGVGLAPNIAPAVGGVVEITLGALLGIGIGLVGGIVAMLLLCRFAVAPVVRRVPRLIQDGA
jgi:hypothetical protein